MRRGAPADDRGVRARVRVAAENNARALDVRRDLRRRQQLPRALRSVEPASDAQVERLAEALNRRIGELWAEASESEWYRLFKRVDSDGSGAISYFELRRLVRNELKLSPKELPEP